MNKITFSFLLKTSLYPLLPQQRHPALTTHKMSPTHTHDEDVVQYLHASFLHLSTMFNISVSVSNSLNDVLLDYS